MQLTFHTLDVFTDKRFGGNPLAVVLGADALDAASMHAIAREFNLSETVFMLKADNPAHSARMRIFTPTAELPFAGHPTVGAAILLAELRVGDFKGEQDAIVVLEQPIGTVRVGVRLRRGQAGFAEFDAPRKPQDDGGLPSAERLGAALGLIPSEIGFENHKPARFAAGNRFAYVPVATLEAMANARVNAAHWAAVFGGQGLVGTFLYSRQCLHTTSSFHARMFAPDSGIAEDPATGSAAAAFAGVVHRFDDLPDGSHRRVIEQGFEMNRPSLINLTLEVQRGVLNAVRIGGQAVRVTEGTLHV